jgi:hypothetical protein
VERVIAKDFLDFRKAGLTHPMMADVENDLDITTSATARSSIGRLASSAARYRVEAARARLTATGAPIGQGQESAGAGSAAGSDAPLRGASVMFSAAAADTQYPGFSRRYNLTQHLCCSVAAALSALSNPACRCQPRPRRPAPPAARDQARRLPHPGATRRQGRVRLWAAIGHGWSRTKRCSRTSLPH